MPQVDTKVEEITVAEIVGPQISERTGKPGPYKIKDSKGRRWSMWSETFEKADVAIGRAYAAMYTSKPYTYVNSKTGMQQTGTDNTIVGLNPMFKNPADKPPNGPIALDRQVDDRSEDIAINGYFHTPLAEPAMKGDAVAIAKAINTMRLGIRLAKKQAVMGSSANPAEDSEFNDEIPF